MKSVEEVKLEAEVKVLEYKIKVLENEIFQEQKRILFAGLEKMIGRKCEWCGCYEGIHKSTCLFMIKYSL